MTYDTNDKYLWFNISLVNCSYASYSYLVVRVSNKYIDYQKLKGQRDDKGSIPSIIVCTQSTI